MKESQKDIIKNICKEFNCTQKELADKFGFSISSIRQWSCGAKKIPPYFYKSVEFAKKIKDK